MIVSARALSTRVRNWLGIRDVDTKKKIEFVTRLDTEAKTVVVRQRDYQGGGEVAMRADFELYDMRTNETLTQDQLDQVERDMEGGAERLVDRMMLDLDGLGLGVDQLAELHRKWVFVASRWCRLR